MNMLRWLGAGLLVVTGVAGLASTVAAKPYLPTDDAQVLEQLPERLSPALVDLKRRRALLARLPSDERMATAFARQAIDAARATGDPRYLGQAQAALKPWWNRADASGNVLLLRATIRQSQHDFPAALADLDRLLADEPEHVQARLTRATVLTVRGHYADARTDCTRLAGRVPELVAVACAAAPEALTGDAAGAYRRLTAATSRASNETAAIRGWVEALAGEIAAREGDRATAERHFKAALAADPADAYAKAALADVLLDERRYRDVVALLGADVRNDSLLLRLALAEKELAAEATQVALHVAWLRDRFDAAHRRGDALHLREEARFALAIDGDAPRAVALARRNFAVQREPADLRVLIEAARAADDAAALDLGVGWMKANGQRDWALQRPAGATT
jgi:tetratricopeptide (TPR) repeat protein